MLKQQGMLNRHRCFFRFTGVIVAVLILFATLNSFREKAWGDLNRNHEMRNIEEILKASDPIFSTKAHNSPIGDGDSNSEKSISGDGSKDNDSKTKYSTLAKIANQTKLKIRDLKRYRPDEPLILYDEGQDSNSHHHPTMCYVEATLSICGDPGIASIALYSAELLTSCLVLGAVPVVKWGNCNFCGTNSDEQADHFSWFFERPESKDEHAPERGNKMCLVSPEPPVRAYGESILVDLSFNDTGRREKQVFVSNITPNTRILAHFILKKYFRPVYEVRQAVEEGYKRTMEGYFNIGVHVRATDHVKEVTHLISLDHWVSETKKVVKLVESADDTIPQSLRQKFLSKKMNTKSVRIFLATDNEETVVRFKKEFGEKVHWNVADRVPTFYYPDPRHFIEDARLARTVGRAVLRDILMMSKCDLLLHEESSLSAMAHYLNLDLVSYYLRPEKSGAWLPTLPSPRTEEDVKTTARKLLNDARETFLQKTITGNFTNTNMANNYANVLYELMACFAKNRFKSQCSNAQNFNFVSTSEYRKLV